MDIEMSLEKLPCGVIIADKGLNILFWNREMERLTGVSAKDALALNLKNVKFYPIQYTERETLDFRECFRSNRTKVAKTAFAENKSGKRTLVFIHGRFLETEGKLLPTITVTDISGEISCSPVTGDFPLILNSSPFSRIIGRDAKMLELFNMVQLAAESVANVLITGESGTGKELIADAIHELSPRKKKPFVKVNCSSLPETLLESELFGHVRGSFTGAVKDKKGKFEEAEGGTVFLDEIGEISPMIQVKLLRVIQEKTIERVGDNRPVRVDMRIITATNRNLRELVNSGQFREDLFYRLSVFPIHTPPLRDRKNDIPLLVNHFISKFNTQTGKHIKGLSEDAYRILMDHYWPGNVRELENSIEHAFVLCNKKMIDVFDLPQDIRQAPLRQVPLQPVVTHNLLASTDNSLKQGDKRYEFRNISKEKLNEALISHRYNRAATADFLGVSRVALWQKMKKLGII